jgi:hypothetical protein
MSTDANASFKLPNLDKILAQMSEMTCFLQRETTSLQGKKSYQSDPQQKKIVKSYILVNVDLIAGQKLRVIDVAIVIGFSQIWLQHGPVQRQLEHFVHHCRKELTNACLLRKCRRKNIPATHSFLITVPMLVVSRLSNSIASSCRCSTIRSRNCCKD